MGRKKKQETVASKNLAVGIVFIVVIGLLIAGSVMLKVFDLVRRSSYDGSHRYTIAVANDTSGSSDKNYIVSFVPENNSITVLVVNEIQKDGDTTKIVNAQTVGKYVGIPIDSIVFAKNSPITEFDTDNKKVDSLLQNIIFSYPSLTTQMTVLDVMRVFFFAKTVPPSSVHIEELEPSIEEAALDKKVAVLFEDSAISSEKQSVQIINGTDISGFGSRLARIVSNAGGNVVSVISSKEEIESSEIHYTGEKPSYTAKKFARLLRIRLVSVQDTGISDIIIKIGKDKKDSSLF